MKFQATQISLLISGLFLAAGVNAQQTTTDVGTINVEGQPGGTGSGLIQQEETPKARSSVSRDYINKQGATANPYQLINLLPGVTTYGNDATGLFGGGIRVRSFNSDQLGFTINGAPVNDSGNFAVFPQEYTDQENLCSIFVTQGSTDTDAPHVGATGGNIGIQSCSPKDQLDGTITQTIGSDSLRRTFVRVDSGKLFDGLFKFYLSDSHAEAAKFRGKGGAFRDHVDFGARLDLGRGSYIDATYLYNRAINNNYRTLSKADIAKQGYYADFGTIGPVHQTPVAGTAQNDATFAPNAGIYSTAPGQTSADNFYGGSLNPFKNYIGTVNGHWQIAPTMSLDINPYMWYGYGTGGNELFTLRETRGANVLHGGTGDLNGDGDVLDTVGYYNGNVTKTYRPGVTTKFSFALPYNRVVLGYWYEKARHQQTAPYIPIDNTGQAADIWEATQSQWVKSADGQPVNSRDWYTVNTAKQPFVQDNIGLLDDKLNIQVGIRHTGLNRNFKNSANLGTSGNNTSGADYVIERNYSKMLPSLGASYHFTPEQSVFANAAKNFRAPNNFSLSALVTGGTFVNGALTGYTVRDPQVTPEKSWNYDLGYRYAGDRWTFSGSGFYINYDNRIATAFDPVLAVSTDTNVGHSTAKGAELESGFKLTNQVTLYGSVSYILSKINDDFRFSQTITLPTSGKLYPGTSRWLGGLNLEYATGPLYAFAQTKWTGKTYSTLVNDDAIGGYALVNLGSGYTFPSTSFLKAPTVRANIFNLFSRKYLSLSSGSGNSFRNNASPVVTPGGTKAAETPTFYVGSPITFTVSVGASFQ